MFQLLTNYEVPFQADILRRASASKCEEFGQFFNNKIIIRAGIIRSTSNPDDLPCKRLAIMRNFSSITEAELCKMVKRSKPSTSCLDPVPTKLLKNVFNSVLSPLLILKQLIHPFRLVYSQTLLKLAS